MKMDTDSDEAESVAGTSDSEGAKVRVIPSRMTELHMLQ